MGSEMCIRDRFYCLIIFPLSVNEIEKSAIDFWEKGFLTSILDSSYLSIKFMLNVYEGREYR